MQRKQLFFSSDTKLRSSLASVREEARASLEEAKTSPTFNLETSEDELSPITPVPSVPRSAESKTLHRQTYSFPFSLSDIEKSLRSRMPHYEDYVSCQNKKITYTMFEVAFDRKKYNARTHAHKLGYPLKQMTEKDEDNLIDAIMALTKIYQFRWLQWLDESPNFAKIKIKQYLLSPERCIKISDAVTARQLALTVLDRVNIDVTHLHPTNYNYVIQAVSNLPELHELANPHRKIMLRDESNARFLIQHYLIEKFGKMFYLASKPHQIERQVESKDSGFTNSMGR